MRNILLCLVVGSAFQAPAWSQDVRDEIEVVGHTPLRAGVTTDEIASNVQAATADDLREQHTVDMAEFMRRNFAGVFVNEAQGNPLQPDVQYRGFVGSPLLGLPQGIAVYVDGVRMNEPFGDTVNWALIPKSAIDTVYLVPGSDPLFGLNALGGAVSLTTRSGFTTQGTSAEILGGSFGRRSVQAQTGGSTDRLAYFVTASYFGEEGWREYSPSDATTLFAKLGWRAERTSIDFGAGYTETDLVGNGATPVQLLALNRNAVFTRPDRTQNRQWLFNVTLSHEPADGIDLTANAYARDSDIATLNGDDSDFDECDDAPGFLCALDDGEAALLTDDAGNPIPALEELEGATINRTGTRQLSVGTGIQAHWTGTLLDRENRFLIGAAFDDSHVKFDASTELGDLDETRLAVPGGVLVGDAFTKLETEARTVGIYVADVLRLTDRTSLTVSGRFNRIDLTLVDRLGTALDGEHVFSRFNPAAGMTVKLYKDLAIYAGYGESNRAPSPVELTCADEDDPCRLPNAFLADPPLEQVVARTWEAGIRGNRGDGSWHVGLFRTVNEDDILFISAGALTNEGFFDNIGRTRRDGLEVGIDGTAGDYASWFISYTYLDATFRDPVILPSANNPAAIDGEVAVQRGDRLPLIPRHLFKAGFRTALGQRLTLAGQLLAGSRFFLRDDEGNDTAATGDYAVVNLRGEYRLSDSAQLLLIVDNVLNAKFETFGTFGQAADVLGDDYDDSRFLSPAAPTGAWLGLQLAF